MAQVAPKNWNWWYDSIIDQMLANPEATLTQIAENLGVTLPWLSIIKNSDMFQERFLERRGMLSGTIDHTIKEKLSKVAMKALDSTLERLEGDGAAKIQTATLIEIADKSLTRLGYGVKPSGPSVVINQNSVTVGASKEALEAARERIRHDEIRRVAEPARISEVPTGPGLLVGIEGEDS